MGKGSSDAVSPDMFTAEVSSDAVPDVRSPATPAGRRDLSTPKTFVLRSVLKKPSVKMCLESLQVRRELNFLKQMNKNAFSFKVIPLKCHISY